MLVTDYISRRSPSSWQGVGVADYSGVVGGYIYVSEASYIVRKFEFTKDCSKKKYYIIVSSSFRPHIVYSPTDAVPSFNPRLTTISLTKAYE
jgi:hypothetical protein